MAKSSTTTLSIFFLFFLLLSLLAADAIADTTTHCPRIPSMTAEHACMAITGTRRMHELCLRTLRAGDGTAAVPVTRHAAVAVCGALESYVATVAAATSLLDAGEVAADDEKAAVGECMVGYRTARGAMARVADDLASGCGQVVELKVGYMAGLRGMDGCRRGLINYPASPLYGRNLADRNVTLLAALLCNLVVTAPLG